MKYTHLAPCTLLPEMDPYYNIGSIPFIYQVVWWHVWGYTDVFQLNITHPHVYLAVQLGGGGVPL